RDVVGQPFGDFSELLDRAGAGLLVELAHCGRPGVLALVDATLGHLPDVAVGGMLGPAGTAADEHTSCGVDEHHADALTIRQVLVTGHVVAMSPIAAAPPPAGPHDVSSILISASPLSTAPVQRRA